MTTNKYGQRRKGLLIHASRPPVRTTLNSQGRGCSPDACTCTLQPCRLIPGELSPGCTTLGVLRRRPDCGTAHPARQTAPLAQSRLRGVGTESPSPPGRKCTTYRRRCRLRGISSLVEGSGCENRVSVCRT